MSRDLIIDSLQDADSAKTSLRSKAYAKVIDLVCEGEIEGLVDGLKSVYLDETPVQNADGSENFKNVFIDSRVGTQDQTYLEGFDAVENTVNVGTEVFTEQSVTRTINNAEINDVRIILQVPALYLQSGADILGSQVEFNIDVQSNGGGFVTVLNRTIRGKATSPYERSFRIPLTGDAPWDIRVVRVTANSAGLSIQNRLFFKSYTEIITSKLSYPNSAVIGLKFDSANFQSIPSRAYELKLLKVKVPSNYNPTTREYTGVWDGTFAADKVWTDNPAWAYYDLLTNTRYGLGDFIDSTQVDKWSIYEIAKYCDELVPSGSGGMEPRFSINIYLQSQEEAYRVLNDLTSIFRGMGFWSSGSVTLVQDAPKDAEYLFTNANVIDGMFNYSGAASKAKHTVALVAWNDPSDFYRQKIEYVEDQDAILEYGVVSTEVSAIGCTSRGQAHRVGKWLLYTEQNESLVLTFKTATEAAILRPGAIIKVSDELIAGTRTAGRIAASTTSSVTLDGDYALPAVGGSLSVMLASGVAETKTILSVAGRVVTVSGEFSSAPPAHGIWMISTDAAEPRTFKVLSVVEERDGLYSVTALAHDPQKYAAIEQGIKLEDRTYSILSPIVTSPTNLKASEGLFESVGQIRTKVALSWDQPANATGYQVQYYRESGNEVILPAQVASEVEILDVTPGTYTFSVVAINSLGKRSQAATLTKELYGKLAPPVDVTGFSILPSISNIAILTWDRATDLDVLNGGQVRLRWTPTVDPEWKNAIDIVEALPGTATSSQVPLLEGTYMAKFIDSSGKESVNTAEIFTTVPYGNALNAVLTVTEHSDFPGTKENCEVSVDYGGLILSGVGTLDDEADFDSMDDMDFLGALSSTGTYYFENTEDLGAVYPCRITALIEVEAFDIDDFIDSRVDDIDTWTDFDGDAVTDVYARLYMRTTEDDPSGVSPEWTEWKPFFIGEYTARGFEFKLELSTDNSNHNLVVKQLAVTIDMPDRVESQRNVVSGTSTYSVTYPYAFWQTPGIVISAYNMASGDYYSISNQTASGFDIVFKNTGGTNVSRTFDYVAKGFGRVIP